MEEEAKERMKKGKEEGRKETNELPTKSEFRKEGKKEEREGKKERTGRKERNIKGN